MTSIYFVRHAQPNYAWKDDRTRPLTDEGKKDCEQVQKILCSVPLTYAVSSPYKRSMDTIKDCAKAHNLKVHTDERLRERHKGTNGNNFEMFQKRWANFDYHEDNGESLAQVQKRNIEALFDILKNQSGQNILLGTHGTALSTILNYYDHSYGCTEFLRMIDYMPYIIRLDFEGTSCICKEEILIIQKEFKRN